MQKIIRNTVNNMKETNLLHIRALGGSQNFAFEELCCQLALLEEQPRISEYFRKGLGADAGVECFTRSTNGDETGWQSKYFSNFGTSQTQQLTESFSHALERHPRLVQYIVCLPINLRDSRVGKQKTELERWLDWRNARLSEATSIGRNVEITLWQASDI